MEFSCNHVRTHLHLTFVLYFFHPAFTTKSYALFEMTGEESFCSRDSNLTNRVFVLLCRLIYDSLKYIGKRYHLG